MALQCDVRRYDDSLKDEVWQVHDEALRDSAMDFSPEYNRYLRHIEREFLDEGGEFFVAVNSDGILAIGGFQPLSALADSYSAAGLPPQDEPLDAVCRFRSIAVRPECQSQGVGTELVSELERRASEVGFEKVVLQTTESLEQAKRFYESRGYQVIEDSDDSEHVWYEKEL